jgi:hypothetical protein
MDRGRRHAESGGTYVIRGAPAVTLAGTGFDLEIGSRSLGALSWRLESNVTAMNAAECEERTLALVAELVRSSRSVSRARSLARR